MIETHAANRCIVLGGSGAVGAAICRVLLREGSRIALSYYANRERAVEVAGETGSHIFSVDLADIAATQTAMRDAARRLGGLDSLVIAAGISGDPLYYQCVAPNRYDKLQFITREAFDDIVAVNTRGALFACQTAATYLQESGGGNIVIVSSMDGIKSVPSPIHFAASKSALKGMTEALSKELGNYNIRVNIVAPGILDEGASRVLGPEMTDSYLKHCSFKRFGKVEEVAELASWLAIENTYVTGQSLLVNGGL